VSTVREQVMTAAIARLNASPPSGIPAFTRTRFEPYGAEELPAATVKWLREEIEYEKGGKWGPYRRRVATMRLSLYCLGDESVLDPMIVWATSQLDGQFSPLIEDCIEALYEFQYALEDERYVGLALDFRIHYHTIVGDQTRAQ
jgi:hypothetical protein